MVLLKKLPWEALIWITGLLMLALYDPGEQDHIAICPLSLLGFEHCPGCGLGRSISLLFHGEWYQSFITHPLGFFAVIILSLRIINLLKNHKPHGPHH